MLAAWPLRTEEGDCYLQTASLREVSVKSSWVFINIGSSAKSRARCSWEGRVCHVIRPQLYALGSHGQRDVQEDGGLS